MSRNINLGVIVNSQIPTLIQLVLASLLAHNLSQQDYGTFNLLKNIIIMGYAFVSFGFERTVLNLQKNSSLRTITNNIVPIRAVLFISAAVGMLIYTTIIGILPLLIFLSVACLAPAIFDIRFGFDINQTVHKDVSINVMRAAPLLLLIPLLFVIDSGELILTLHFILLLGGYMLYVFLQHRHLPGLIGRPETTHSWKFLRLGIFTFLGSVAASLNLYLSSILIEARLGLGELAIYSVALTIYAGVLSLFTLIVRFFVSEYLSSDRPEHEFKRCLVLVLPLWLLITVVFTFYGRTLIGIVFGAGYDGAYASVQILLFSLLVAPLSIYFNSLLIIKGSTIMFMLVRYTGLAVNLVTVLILTGALGISGAALGMLLGMLWTALSGTLVYYRLSHNPI
ncbi:MAG: hypothetical protein R3F41_00845 [Gammaproteobacteria bacterium]|nr:hypothetical protein [Pseudomonadales bacterium]